MGSIIGPHGLKSYVALFLFNPQTTLKKGRMILVGDTGEEKLEIEKISKGNKVLVKLLGLNSIEAIEYLAKKKFFIKRSDLPVLKSGEYYLCDLMDAQILNESGQVIGRAAGFYENGPQLVLQISGTKNFDIPFVPTFILSVDAIDKKITVREPEFIE